MKGHKAAVAPSAAVKMVKEGVQRRGTPGSAQFLPKPTPPSPIRGYEKHVQVLSSSRANILEPTPQQKNSGPAGAAAMPVIFPPPMKPEVKHYQVQIKNMQFIPSHLRIEKGSTVTWKVCPDSNGASSYSGISSRSHIIMFEEIFVESPKLELPGQGHYNDTFSLNF